MQNIPIYVYILFCVLLYIGIKRCFTHTIHISRLILAPALFTFLSYNGAIRIFGTQASVFSCLILGNILGIFIGYQFFHKLRIKAIKDQNCIQIPGNVFMLFLVMSIFFIEFFIHYAVDADWQIISNHFVRFTAILISGMVAGISIARNLIYYLKFGAANVLSN